ncbi:MAG: sulfatase [Vicinamibacteria bacterium]|nr:sulfatase [Vicinamibacteria bacterium]
MAAAGLSGCNHAPRAVDLLHTQSLTEADVGGRERTWVGNQIGRIVRLHDVARRTLPASPPSRLRYTLTVPARAHLAFSCGIPADHHERPPVEFSVRIRDLKRNREETVWTKLLDPITHPDHRRWVDSEVDLGAYAGRKVDLTLVTSGYEQDEDAMRAYWGAPALIPATEQADAPLVIVYLVDTLRADHTTVYGYDRPTTPELARFAQDAVVFDQAIAQASWTKPSIASLMTALLPGQHRAVQLRDPLDEGLVTIGEMLQGKNFSTGAMIANSVIYSEGVNFEQGFDEFVGLHGADDRPSKIVEAAGVVDQSLAWLQRKRGLPRFLYIHTMDPHVPYTPPAPYDRMFPPAPTTDNPARDPRTDYKEPLDRERMIGQYDGEIAYGDREFGRFIQELKARGLYDRATIVFLGDHGEEFRDHGQWLHGRSVFDELVHIPLIVKFPGARDRGRRIAQQVQVVDVLPTILSELKLPVPEPPAIAGRPLQKVIAGGAPEPPAISEISHRGYVAHGMRTSKDKYIQRFSPEEDELYFDLHKDPKEKINLMAPTSERIRLLKAGVEAAMTPNPFRYNLLFTGSSVFELRLRTRGWIEGVEPVGFGPQDRYEEGNGRRLILKVRPQPNRPRTVIFGVRPMGAPVWLEGTRDGRPLSADAIWIAEQAVHPEDMPMKLPEIETEKERVENIFVPPPKPRPGLSVWLTVASGRSLTPMDSATCKTLEALGYIQCRSR